MTSPTAQLRREPSARGKRWHLQFGISTVLLLMIPIGLSLLCLRNYLDNRPMEWAPYSAKTQHRELYDGRIVLISISADWCLNGIYVERTAIETPKVKQFIRSHRVVAMRADWTNDSAEVRDALQSIGARSIPVIAIYSPSFPNDPIVLTDLVTEQQVLDALETALARSKTK